MITTLFCSKIIVAAVLIAFVYHVCQTITYGRRIRGIPNGTSPLHSSMQSRYRAVHEKYAKRSFWILVLAVCAIEAIVTFLAKPVYDALFWIHLSTFAFPCVILLGCIVFKYTGQKRPDIHGRLVYRVLLPTLIGTLITGIPLLYRL